LDLTSSVVINAGSIKQSPELVLAPAAASPLTIRTKQLFPLPQKSACFLL
jgi:hypothetical protein